MKSFTLWFKGLLAAFISQFATAVCGVIALPSVFTLDKTGLVNVIKMGTPPALLAVFLYLKESPVPKDEK